MQKQKLPTYIQLDIEEEEKKLQSPKEIDVN
jgi:hypothetical protein